MAITRAQMRRQLYRGGGIASVPRRQRYGLGSKWQDFKDDVVDKFQKIVPNEIAEVATKAAPLVAPFNPLAAGLMRGLGRLDQRGDLGDALKQGLLTYGGGQAARYLGGAGMQTGINPMSGMGGGMLTSPIQAGGPIANTWASLTGAKDAASPITQTLSGVPGGGDKGMFYKAPAEAAKGLGLWDKAKGAWDAIPGGRLGKMATVFAGGTGLSLLADKLVGPKKPEETMEQYMTRRKSTVGKYLKFYYKRTNPLASEQEVADFVAQNTGEYANGGRVGYSKGTPKIPEQFLEDLKRKKYEDMLKEKLDEYKKRQRKRMMAPTQEAAQGGRVGYNMGIGPAGLPGIPRMAPDGIEYDMRARGGFQPLGAQEGKDDVNAKLAKNEFVFTADAVRAAGGGSIQKGAQRMYDTMKRLESRVA